jgi:arylsulfatase A-like enzyme
MAASGLRFNRFYAGAPLCSPTRGSVLTGRHPNRFGCFSANFCIRPEEVTIAEALRNAGCAATGHFGKWHVGPVKADSPVNPNNSGFSETLSHDNWFDINPQLCHNGGPPQTFEGETSEIVMDAALEFIRQQAAAKRAFLVLVWFPSPHTPCQAAEKYKAPYKHLSEQEQNYYGEIAAVDAAMGKLRKTLRDLGVADNTLVWFNSDNGCWKGDPGSTAGLRDRKGTLWEGGIRVPGLLEWPARIKKPMVTDIPCSTLDIYPTILDILGLKVIGQVTPLDGISLLPLMEGRMQERPKPIPFWQYRAAPRKSKPEQYLDAEAATGTWRTFRNDRHKEPRRAEELTGHAALVGNRYKLHKMAPGRLELYDLAADPGETKDLAQEKPEVTKEMAAALEVWQLSVEQSLMGRDYAAPTAAMR